MRRKDCKLSEVIKSWQIAHSFKPSHLPKSTPYSRLIKLSCSLHPDCSIIMHFLAVVLTTALILYNTVTTTAVLRSLDNAPVQHFTITRRGGKFEPTVFGCDYVNMTYLAQELAKTEARFNLTKREVKGNKLIRKAKSDGSRGRDLTEQVATEGIWYATPNIQGSIQLIVYQVC